MFARKSDLDELKFDLANHVKVSDSKMELYRQSADVRYDRNLQEIRTVREGLNATLDILIDVVMALLDQPYIFDHVAKRIYDSKKNKKEE